MDNRKDYIPLGIKQKIRIVLLMLMVLVIFWLGTVRLMQLQLVNGAYYFAQSQQTKNSTVRINAARGEIVDRYGRPLAVNKTGFNVVFRYILMPHGEENEIISVLINIMTAQGNEWNDNLPITQEEPYQFLDGMENSISSLKTMLKLQQYATAENCMDALIDMYGIEENSPKKIRQIAGVRYEMKSREFSENNSFTFAEDVSKETVIKIQEMSFKLPGVSIVENSIHEYVSGDIAPHLIGMIGPIYAEELDNYKKKGYSMDALVGVRGIEKEMEEYLRGIDGELTYTQNAKGDIISEEITKTPQPGNTVVLTIDKNFQKDVQDILEGHIKYLNEAIDTNGLGKNADAGAVAVLDARNGDILALATYPSYDIGESYYELLNAPGNPLKNRAINEIYRPGSTFKTVTAAGALNTGVIDQNTHFTCNYIYRKLGPSFTPKCWSTAGHGSLSVIRAISASCNIFFYETGRLLGIEELNKYASYFGLGEPTGIEIPEATGTITSPETVPDWSEGAIVQASIGQMENKFTPLQLAVQAMTFANKGVRYEAHLVKSIKSFDYSETVLEKGRNIVSEFQADESVFDLITQGMIGSARSAPAKYSLKKEDLGYEVAIKTGTPQISSSETSTAIIGFSPVDNPEIAIGIIVEKGEYSKNMVRQIIDAYEKTKNGNNEIPQDENVLID